MPRNNRVVFEGAIYHIYQRGNNHQYIFEEAKHKDFFIKLIKEYNRIYDFQFLAFAIMGNHYHLIIKANKVSISEIMFSINNVLGKYLNRQLNRSGPIFESRFKSKVISNEAYLIWLLRYIHRNPVRANICKTADEYKWSSHYFYKEGINGFVNSDFILNRIANNKEEALKKYNMLLEIQENIDKIKDFEKVKNELKLSDSKEKHEVDKSISYRIKSLELILDEMKIDNGTKELLKMGSKKRNLTKYKIQFIEEAIKNKFRLKEIGNFMSISQAAVSNILAYYNRRAEDDSNI